VGEFWFFTNHGYAEVMPGNRFSRREPEVGFWEVCRDRYW